jgi:PPOX class probable F420-dependent enzyme
VDPDTMRERVIQGRVARLATVRPDGAPHVVPVCFAVVDDVVYTAVDDKPKTTRALQRVRNLAAEPRVTLLVDHYDDDWRRLWWVRVDGLARVLDEGKEHRRAVEALKAKYPNYRDVAISGAVLAIDVRTRRGWAYDDSG